MSFHSGNLQGFPHLDNGCRYSDEERNAKSIPSDIRPEVLQLLRKYYTEVCLKGRTSSDGSRTSAPSRSEASTGTSITDNTPTFSIDNRPVKPEPARRPLDNVTRARKALLRKLGACQEDCRRRKVKVTAVLLDEIDYEANRILVSAMASLSPRPSWDRT